jgi:hypothetical protein
LRAPNRLTWLDFARFALFYVEGQGHFPAK